jgi:hypothetical protein
MRIVYMDAKGTRERDRDAESEDLENKRPRDELRNEDVPYFWRKRILINPFC